MKATNLSFPRLYSLSLFTLFHYILPFFFEHLVQTTCFILSLSLSFIPSLSSRSLSFIPSLSSRSLSFIPSLSSRSIQNVTLTFPVVLRQRPSMGRNFAERTKEKRDSFLSFFFRLSSLSFLVFVLSFLLSFRSQTVSLNRHSFILNALHWTNPFPFFLSLSFTSKLPSPSSSSHCQPWSFQEQSVRFQREKYLEFFLPSKTLLCLHSNNNKNWNDIFFSLPFFKFKFWAKFHHSLSIVILVDQED